MDRVLLDCATAYCRPRTTLSGAAQARRIGLCIHRGPVAFLGLGSNPINSGLWGSRFGAHFVHQIVALYTWPA